MVFLKFLLHKLSGLVRRWPGVVALLGFIAGVASFLLVERRESLAQLIGMLMLVSWAWLVLENWLRSGLLARFGFDVSPAVMRFVTQMVHQESLFFALPFFLATTTWDHGHAVFTAMLLLCALISVIDPIYYKWLAPRRSLFVIFHALALFAVLLVVLPLILQLTTGQSLGLALVVALLFSFPSLGQLLPNGHWWRAPLLGLMLVGLAASLWQARGWVPPASLRLTGIALSQEVDRAQREPNDSISRLDEAALNGAGLYAWTSVRAPRGLSERIHHVWLLDGVEVDRINIDIRGGREEGYRAWTQKVNFPKNSVGHWQVRVVTDSGQLIGLRRFEVTSARPSSTSRTDIVERPPPDDKLKDLEPVRPMGDREDRRGEETFANQKPSTIDTLTDLEPVRELDDDEDLLTESESMKPDNAMPLSD